MSDQPTISYTDEEIEELRQEFVQKAIINDFVIEAMYDVNPDLEYDDDEEVIKAEEFLELNPELHEKSLNMFKRGSQPGTYNCHEALDRTSLIMNMLDSHLLEKDAIINNPEWFKMAHEAHTSLFNLYQAIGAVHLDAIPDNIVDLIELAKKED